MIARQLQVDPLHPDYIELAPDNWFETRELTARFRYDRPDLTKLDRLSYDQFRQRIDLTKPLFIETDGACSGNPGSGGWGFIIGQGNMKIEAYGAEGSTSNNEMELRAIDEALGFLGNARGYAVIESDSQGCLDMMTGKGQQSEAANYTKLDGSQTKNKHLVSNVTTKLRSINAQFRKVKGHNGDQWNDAVDALADKGRDEAINGPKCSFDIMIPARAIAHRVRAVREFWTLAEVYKTLKTETQEKDLPSVYDMKLFKAGAPYSGKWTTGHYQIVHKSLPPPAAPAAAQPARFVAKPAPFGIWNGKKHLPTHGIDISALTEDERLDIFNDVFPIGREVRYFVSNTEVQEDKLEAGQPYSVYPKRFKRTAEATAKLTERALPPRMEGPFIRIQWTWLSHIGEVIILPTEVNQYRWCFFPRWLKSGEVYGL
jgi:ribonuclease HI